MRNNKIGHLWSPGLLLLFGFLFLLGGWPGPGVHAASVPTTVGVAANDESDSSSYEYDADKDESDWNGDGNDVVRMGESIEIDPDETIDGDVVAIGGAVTVYGRVRGDVVSVGGGIDLKSGSVVEGDVVSVGGPIEREEGAIVKGQNVKVGSIPGGLWWLPKGKDRLHERHRACPSFSGATVAKGLVSYIGMFLCGLIFFLAFPKRGMVVRSTLRSRFWLSLLAGLGSMVAAAIVVILLCITCIGILVAIPGFIGITLIILASGAVAVGAFGEVLLRRDVRDSNTWLGTFVIGLAILFAVNIVGWLFCSLGVTLLGRIILAIVKAAWFVFLATGFGALVLSRWGAHNPAEPPPIPSWVPAGGPNYAGGAAGPGTYQPGSHDWSNASNQPNQSSHAAWPCSPGRPSPPDATNQPRPPESGSFPAG